MSAADLAPFAVRLQGGDRRSIGQADTVAATIRAQPTRFAELWDCLTCDDGVVRMRAADALEKLGRDAPDLFSPHKAMLLSGELDDGTPELRWHLVAIASRLALSDAEAEDFAFRCNQIIRHDRSRIVRVMALQALFDITGRHPALGKLLAEALAFAAASAAVLARPCSKAGENEPSPSCEGRSRVTTPRHYETEAPDSTGGLGGPARSTQL